jgi:glucose uptake protein GlcU
VRAGLVVLVAGALGDFLYHALPDTFAPLFGADGFRAHLVTFVGMLIMLVGVFRQGLTQPRSLAARGGAPSHAHR